MKNKEYQICTNCVMDTTDSKITFDENGVCDHCQTFYKDIKPNWHTDEKGFQEISKIAEQIKKEGQAGRNGDPAASSASAKLHALGYATEHEPRRAGQRNIRAISNGDNTTQELQRPVLD